MLCGASRRKLKSVGPVKHVAILSSLYVMLRPTDDNNHLMYAVSNEPAGEQESDGVGQGLGLATGLRGGVISYRFV